ncbi:MAG: caspase family protein, partial [Rhizomicrobium sp.]
FDDAIADYNAALSHNPKMASALFMRGVTELRKGEKEKGEADVRQAEAIYPLIGSRYAIYGISP